MSFSVRLVIYWAFSRARPDVPVSQFRHAIDVVLSLGNYTDNICFIMCRLYYFCVNLYLRNKEQSQIIN